MVIVRRDFETKEIEIRGFRKILQDPKHPNRKEVTMYMKNGWIITDSEDDEKELLKDKKRKQTLKENKARRPSYKEIEKSLNKLLKDKKIEQEVLNSFNSQIKIKGSYISVLKWYNEILENIPKETNQEPKESKTEAKNSKK